MPKQSILKKREPVMKSELKVVSGVFPKGAKFDHKEYGTLFKDFENMSEEEYKQTMHEVNVNAGRAHLKIEKMATTHDVVT